MLIVPKQVYQTETKKQIKASAYSPETGLQDRKKNKLKHLLIVPKQVYKTDKNKIIKAFAYSPETGLPDRKKKQIKGICL